MSVDSKNSNNHTLHNLLYYILTIHVTYYVSKHSVIFMIYVLSFEFILTYLK